LNKVKIADELNTLLTDLYRTEATFPYGVTYDTKSSIKNFIEKIMIKQKNGSTIFTIDSPTHGNYTKIYSKDFVLMLNSLKVKKNITTKTLIPHDTFKTIDSYKLNSQNIIIKELPPEIDFGASLWILDDLIVFFSGNPPFITAIKHPLIYQSIKSLNNYLWNQSVEVK
jgi:hypothetical protein